MPSEGLHEWAWSWREVWLRFGCRLAREQHDARLHLGNARVPRERAAVKRAVGCAAAGFQPVWELVQRFFACLAVAGRCGAGFRVPAPAHMPAEQSVQPLHFPHVHGTWLCGRWSCGRCVCG